MSQAAAKTVVLSSNTAWSLWNFRRSLIRRLCDTGYRVMVVAPHDEAAEKLETLGCTFVPIAIDNKGTHPLRDARLCFDYWRLYRKLRPFAALHFTIKPVIYGGLACRLLGVPYISMITGLGTAFIRESWLTKMVQSLYRVSQKRAQSVLFQNPDDSALFLERRLVPARAVDHVPGSGIDLDFFSPPAEGLPESPVFLVIARLLWDKGIGDFVAAARAVKARHSSARFQLLGAIGVENRTAIPQHDVDAWVSEGLIEYLGVTDDVRPFIAQASCVVLPSYREGTPRSLLEAAAMGRPVIATDVPGCRQVLDDGLSGYLCEVRNPESLAAAMLRYVELEQAARARMGAAGREKMAREFGERIVIDTYCRILAATPAA